MRIAPQFLTLIVLTLGCNQPELTQTAPQGGADEIRTVTFSSHLAGTVESDPVVKPGQRIRLVPDANEITQNKEAIVVQLPNRTPYDGDDEQNYLRGFAIGKLSAHNIQFM